MEATSGFGGGGSDDVVMMCVELSLSSESEVRGKNGLIRLPAIFVKFMC